MSVKIKEERLGSRGKTKGENPTSSAKGTKRSEFCNDWQGIAKAPKAKKENA